MKRQHKASLSPKKFDLLKQNVIKQRMRVSKNLLFYHCHPDLQSKMREVWAWKPHLPRGEFASQDQDCCQLPHHDLGVVTLNCEEKIYFKKKKENKKFAKKKEKFH